MDDLTFGEMEEHTEEKPIIANQKACPLLFVVFNCREIQEEVI